LIEAIRIPGAAAAETQGLQLRAALVVPEAGQDLLDVTGRAAMAKGFRMRILNALDNN
jgi:hypothetical protein